MNNSIKNYTPFDLTRLRDLLGDLAGRFDVDHIVSCDSTNSQLLERATRGAPLGTAVVADIQTAGRGRRGRVWQSAPGHSLTFSLLWRFPDRFSLAGLSLAVGVAVARALERCGVDGLALKWPNDIILDGRKLGGVLVEVAFDERGAAAVMGIGINLKSHPSWSNLEQPVACLQDANCFAGREALLAFILGELAIVMDSFSRDSFAALRDDWLARHAYQDLPVKINAESRQLIGICRGVDGEGALLLESESGGLSVMNGDVTLRGA
ncbi:MAG TPA: biotin--[acetyl-CoA-carboxylase] ligase [Rhodocyclaceae bacterium]|nr:biotin--[acetyl-CoA-carboxylase] ligase [Rhodocyclaceae bacterium]